MQVCDVAHRYKQYALHERGMRPRSYRSIMASMKMLCDWADTEDLKELSHGVARAFLYWGKEERAWEARTFRNHWQYLRSFFGWCVKQQLIKTNPIDGIEKPKLPKRLPRNLTREDTQTVLNAIRWYPWRYAFEGTRNETIIYLLIYTGLRLHELLDLEVVDVNLVSSEIMVRLGKGQKDRMVPIHPRLLPILRNYVAERRTRRISGTHFFVGAQSEKPLTGKDVRTVCHKLSRDTGIYFTPHMLRHTFGRLMVEADFDIYKIKEVMGHSNISTTVGYLSISTENVKRSFREKALL